MSNKNEALTIEQKRVNALKKELRGMKQRFRNATYKNFQETSLLFLRDLVRAYYIDDKQLTKLALKSYVEVSDVLKDMNNSKINDSVRRYRIALDSFILTFFKKSDNN